MRICIYIYIYRYVCVCVHAYIYIITFTYVDVPVKTSISNAKCLPECFFNLRSRCRKVRATTRDRRMSWFLYYDGNHGLMMA